MSTVAFADTLLVNTGSMSPDTTDDPHGGAAPHDAAGYQDPQWQTWPTLDCGEITTTRLTLAITSSTSRGVGLYAASGAPDAFVAKIETRGDASSPWREIATLGPSNKICTTAIERFVRCRTKTNLAAVSFTVTARMMVIT